MKDLLMTPAGDLDCTNLNLHLVDGPDRVAQQVRTRWRSFLGEWEFDLDYGMPWLQNILGIKGVDLNDVEARLKAETLKVADVNQILDFQLDFTRDTRTVQVSGHLDTPFGQVQVEGVFP